MDVSSGWVADVLTHAFFSRLSVWPIFTRDWFLLNDSVSNGRFSYEHLNLNFVIGF